MLGLSSQTLTSERQSIVMHAVLRFWVKMSSYDVITRTKILRIFCYDCRDRNSEIMTINASEFHLMAGDCCTDSVWV